MTGVLIGIVFPVVGAVLLLLATTAALHLIIMWMGFRNAEQPDWDEIHADLCHLLGQTGPVWLAKAAMRIGVRLWPPRPGVAQV